VSKIKVFSNKMKEILYKLNNNKKELEEVSMLIEKKDYLRFCSNCGSELEENNYIYRHKAPSGYRCSNCGFYEFYEEN